MFQSITPSSGNKNCRFKSYLCFFFKTGTDVLVPLSASVSFVTIRIIFHSKPGKEKHFLLRYPFQNASGNVGILEKQL